ncbi:DUF433 domain-containing protein [Candidatus Pacearchaeota archaeon]|nr:DUF433 domain-containing protein [Candidatus Pacearchaeota archaeon]
MRVEINEYIVADSEVCEGKPVFKGTRIMIWQVLELLAGGVTVDEIIKDYFPQISRKAVLSVLSHASKLVEDEKYVLFR